MLPQHAMNPSSEEGSYMTKEQFNSLLLEVFFFKKLPCEEVEENCDLLRLVCDFMDDSRIVTEWKNNFHVDIHSIQNSIESWRQTQTSPNSISIPHGKSLSSMLDEQDIMPFYLKGNNACLVVRKASSDITDYKFIATAFQIHPTNQELMSNQGYPIITAPEMSVGVYDDCLLKSEDFIDQLQTLCMHLEESIPTSSKHHRKQAEVRDVASPKLVFEWLLPTLSDNVGHVPLTTIQKKVRNSVQWKDCLKPYRRSGLWMCIKTCLHLNLVWLFGIEKGTLLYKIFMLQLMSYLCLKSKGKLSHDLVMQMLSKMSVRMAKLETMIENYSTRTADKDMIVDIQACESLTNLVLQKSLEVVEKLRLGVDHWWSKTMETFSKEYSFAMNFDRVDVKKDIRLSLPKSSEHLNGFKQLQHNAIGKLYEHKPPKDTGPSERDDFDYLCAIEDFIRKEMVNTIVQQDYSIHCSSELFDKLKQYHPKAMKFYKNDPVGKSRLFLAVFNIVRGLHMIAVKNMPLLAKYKSGVDVSTIQSVLLCSQADLQYAYELEQYFNEHDQSASNNSDFLSNSFSPQSFCVQHAEGNESMKKTLQQILDRMEQKKEQKLREVREMKEKYENLQREIRNSKCEYNVDKFGYSRHSNWCHKCRLVRVCENMNIFIYEKDLPEEPYLRNAIVFELNLPHVYGYLRDAFHILCSMQKRVRDGSNKAYCEWRSSFGLSEYTSDSYSPLYVKLKSTVKSFTQSHYSTKHVTYSEDTFIQHNGCNVRTVNDESNQVLVYSLPEVGTQDFYFPLELTPYKSLDWTVHSCAHSHKEVLAKQSTCHANLSLSEFIEFGFVRCGHRLQFHNLAKCLANESLSFDTQDVQRLILQSIWQACLNGETSSEWYREANQCLRETDFSLTLLSLLETLLDKYKENWKSVSIACMMVCMTLRILQVTDSDQVKNRCISLLGNLRKTTCQWERLVEELLPKMHDAPTRELVAMRNHLVQICCCTAMTYSVPPLHVSTLFEKDPDALQTWLKSLTILHDNMLLNKGTDSYGSFMSFLLRQYYMTSHNIEMAIHNEIQRDPSVLSKFITSHWKEACKGELRPWKRYSHTEAHHRWYHSTLTTDLGTTIIEIDVLRGSFLVDGAPVGRLSSSVTAHPDYIRLFSNYVFDVQPGSVKGTYVTRAQINGAFYKFSQFGDTIEIIEQRPERELKLFSDTFFGTDLPYGFVNDYSHWFDCVSNEILFRPKSFFDPNFVSEVEYILDLNENVLTEKSTGRKLLDVHGGIFREILKPMSRIEDSLFLHLFVNATMDEITLDLPRKGLHFTLMEYKYLKSKEFDMNVVEHCNIGTLIGLRSGIVLESKNCERIILVPCGALHVSRKNETGHQQVQIINSDREYPVKYFAYRVNNLLWQLEGEDNLSSWLFLALLHATTSSVVEDPFTRQTGTETALHILHSTRIWQQQPLKEFDLSLLLQIAKLSPTREYYPYHLHEMENATWPADIPSMAAHDAFIIIASKIYEHSQSLSFLYPQPMKDEKKQPPFPHSLFLNERAYFQSINKYNSNAWLSCDNYSTKQVSNFSLPKKQLEPSSKQDTIRRLAWSSRTKSLYVTANIQYEVYGKMTELKQVQEFPSIVEWFTLDDIHCYFLSLYHIVVTKSSSLVTFLLSYLGYKHGSRYETLLAYLLAIHNRRKQFPQLPATTKKIENVKEISLSEQTLKDHLNSDFVSFDNAPHSPQRYYEQPQEYNRRINLEYEQEAQSRKSAMLTIITTCFDRSKTISYSDISSHSQYFSCQSLLPKLQKYMKEVSMNIKLKEFFDTIIKGLKTSPISTVPHLPSLHFPENTFEHNVKANFDILTHMFKIKRSQSSSVLNTGIFRTAKLIFETGKIPDTSFDSFFTSNNSSLFLEYMEELVTSYQSTVDSRNKIENEQCVTSTLDQLWKTVEKLYEPCRIPSSKACSKAGLWPKLLPTRILSQLLFENKSNNPFFHRDLVGAIAILFTHQQRFKRLQALSLDMNKKVLYERELENTGHENWQPSMYPEWLILEIEMNMMIRPIQFEVASNMMYCDSNMVMQFNMGEGKTSVIIPMLALKLNTNQLARLTVLKQLLNTNFTSLVFKLGGILGRKVLTIPFSRDTELESQQLDQLKQSLVNLKEQKGVLITVPEYRLSFELKGLETGLKTQYMLSRKFIELQEWMDTNCRDVLDESDEILHVRYQLIYTIGDQLSLDADSLRWTMLQRIFRLIKRRAKIFAETFERESEFHAIDGSYQSEFPHFRLLDRNIYSTEFVPTLVQDILDGHAADINIPFKKEHRPLLERFMTKEEVSQSEMDQVQQLYEDTVTWNELLIMRGLFAYQTLFHALNKRWRVNYGVRENSTKLMAVPFRAKDVASERAEFGHPDVAILLTLLSYYYSGLSHEQLDTVFKSLECMQNPDIEYQKWLSETPCKENIPSSLRSFHSINLSDYQLKNHQLYPMLSKNMSTVDFYLNRVVLARECKQFEHKLSSSAWNLCKKAQHPTCGFSGTKSCLLPTSIIPNELPALKGTSGDMFKKLLLKENGDYHVIEPNMTTKNVIQQICECNPPIRVLLDVGALMLEMSNEEIALEWLRQIPKDKGIDASVFFNEEDRIMVLDRNGIITPLELSPYKNSLDRCVTYLDDIHTRGTDLRFPAAAKAAVTLGQGVTFERLSQACMRMRLFGKGQTVAFWASKEVDTNLCSSQYDSCKNIQEKIVMWSISNRISMEQEHYLQWATNGLLFSIKQSAKLRMKAKDDDFLEYIEMQSEKLRMKQTDHTLIEYIKRCKEDEITKLQLFYGNERKLQTIAEIFDKRLVNMKQDYDEQHSEFAETISKIKSNIQSRMNDKKLFSQLLNEEQERELEHELELEKQVERPPLQKAAENIISPDVQMFFVRGTIPCFSTNIHSLEHAFEKTSLSNTCIQSCWKPVLYASKEFIEVVIEHLLVKPKHDDYMTPLTWIACSKHNPNIALILSPFEANYFIQRITPKSPVRLYMFCPRLRPQSRMLFDEYQFCTPCTPLTNSEREFSQSLCTDLHVFSGSLYFGNLKEQQELCDFIGIRPKPYETAAEQEAFEKGDINEFGHIHRESNYFSMELESKCRFKIQHPVEEFRKLLIIRDKASLFEISHMANILVKNQKIQDLEQ